MKERRSAADEAARYIENRMHTVCELRRHLEDKGYSEAETEECIEKFKALHYLDDAEYALMYIEYAYDKKRGRKRIIRELEERGVDAQTIQFAFEDYLYEHGNDELETALEIARKEVEGRNIDDRLVAKIARKLESRGYSGEDIISVLSAVRKWKREQERETQEQ